MKNGIFIVVLVIALAACAPASTTATADIQGTAISAAWTEVFLTPNASPTETPTSAVVPSTPLPTQAPPPILTPDTIQVERWKEYQTELAKALFSFPPPEIRLRYDSDEYKKAICEWDILGRSGQELYVWAVCVSDGSWYPKNPAVIYLESDGSIREVNVPREEFDHNNQLPIYDLHLFPIDVQEKLCLHYFRLTPQCSYIIPDYIPPNDLQPRESALLSHLEYRKTHPDEPPVVVLSAMTIATPTATPLDLSPTRTPLPFMALDGLRVAYISKGNLYVQDSGKQAIQLTRSGQDRTPTYSDDGQKIIFYRGPRSGKNQIYVIDADGKGERTLVTTDLLIALGLGYDEFTELHSLAFVPGTHQLLFNTHQLSTVNPKEPGWYYPSNGDLLLLDTGTGEIKRLMEPGQASYFQISPDGKLIWVLSGDHLNVIGLDGKTKLRLTNYPPVSPDTFIAMPDMYWTQDSSRLSLALPPTKTNFGYAGPELRTIWQYSLVGSPGVEIRLTPPLVGEAFSISPDGDWVAYSYGRGLDVPDWDPRITDGVYLGNLRDGTSQLLYTPQLNEVTGFRDEVPVDYDGWSRDSTHFIFHDLRDRMYMGNIHGETVSLGGGMMFGWIDNTRYLYSGWVLGEVGQEEKVRVVEFPAGLVIDPYVEIAFVFLGH